MAQIVTYSKKSFPTKSKSKRRYYGIVDNENRCKYELSVTYQCRCKGSVYDDVLGKSFCPHHYQTLVDCRQTSVLLSKMGEHLPTSLISKLRKSIQ
jgi:hypothetical protein